MQVVFVVLVVVVAWTPLVGSVVDKRKKGFEPTGSQQHCRPSRPDEQRERTYLTRRQRDNRKNSKTRTSRKHRPQTVNSVEGVLQRKKSFNSCFCSSDCRRPGALNRVGQAVRGGRQRPDVHYLCLIRQAALARRN